MGALAVIARCSSSGRYFSRYSGNCVEHLLNNSLKKGASARRGSCTPSYEPSLET